MALAAPAMQLETSPPLRTRVISVQDASGAPLDPSFSSPLDRALWLCSQLESGNILFFPRTPFAFAREDRELLLRQKQTRGGHDKNIAYRPDEDRLSGLETTSNDSANQLRAILRNHSAHVAEFLTHLLPPYAGRWRRHFASFRPAEENGRPARTRTRNDLPHIDAFPTRPSNGGRILRVFTNLNPTRNRVWITSETFDVLAARFAPQIGIPRRSNGALSRILRALNWPGVNHSPYDKFMHRFHNFLKESARFQAECPKQRWEFPPNSTWLAFTDMVSHAELEGQFALEQTFLISREAMVQPEQAPISILENLAGYPLT
jgi:3-deoxy-D-manno-oct-2-ulosonic acid (Kdo) hydroxylase